MVNTVDLQLLTADGFKLVAIRFSLLWRSLLGYTPVINIPLIVVWCLHFHAKLLDRIT